MNILKIALCAASILIVPIGVAARGGGGHGGGHSGGSHSSRSSYGSVSTHEHSVSGYTRRDGTYVHSYKATDPNGTRNDNFSTRGNVNPYTGEAGTKPRDEDPH